MLDFQQKRKIRNIMYGKVTLFVLGLVVLFALHSTWSVYQKKRDSERLKNTALAHVGELEARDIELKAKIERIDTEVGMEEEIRSKFNVAKPEENVVVIVPESSSTSLQEPTKDSFLGRVKKFFGM